jgi:hypothetical protein
MRGLCLVSPEELKSKTTESAFLHSCNLERLVGKEECI